MDKIRIPSVYRENNACANSAYQALSPPLKGPGYEASHAYGAKNSACLYMDVTSPVS